MRLILSDPPLLVEQLIQTKQRSSALPVLWGNPLVDSALRWRHNGGDSVSNHQPHDCLLNRLFRRRSKKTSKLRVTGLCAGNSPGTGEFPAQMASNAENVSIWWRHHGIPHRKGQLCGKRFQVQATSWFYRKWSTLTYPYFYHFWSSQNKRLTKIRWVKMPNIRINVLFITIMINMRCLLTKPINYSFWYVMKYDMLVKYAHYVLYTSWFTFPMWYTK